MITEERTRQHSSSSAASEAACRTPPHNSIALGHLAGSQGEAGGDDSWQALRDGCHRESNCNLEVVDAAAQGEPDSAPVRNPGGPLDWLPGQEVVVIDHPHQDTDGKDDLRRS